MSLWRGGSTGIKACEALGVEVWLLKRHYLSFTNSPYYAHHRLAAIDIYPPRGEREALSPIEGKLLFHKVIGGEHVLGFKSGDAYVRILHVKPYLNVGESVYVGDPLGELVWSPTFFVWTDPHIHLEVRPSESFVRAKGGVKLSIQRDLVNFLRSHVCLDLKLQQKYVVDLVVRGKYVVLKPCSGKAHALPVLIAGVSDSLGVMEGGVPHYGHAGIILLRGRGCYPLRVGSGVLVNDVVAGQVDFASSPYVHAVLSRGLHPVLNGVRVHGVAFFIGASFVKVIPRDWRDFTLSEGDSVVLCFQKF